MRREREMRRKRRNEHERDEAPKRRRGQTGRVRPTSAAYGKRVIYRSVVVTIRPWPNRDDDESAGRAIGAANVMP